MAVVGRAWPYGARQTWGATLPPGACSADQPPGVRRAGPRSNNRLYSLFHTPCVGPSPAAEGPALSALKNLERKQRVVLRDQQTQAVNHGQEVPPGGSLHTCPPRILALPVPITASMPLEGWGQEPSPPLNLTPQPHLSDNSPGSQHLCGPSSRSPFSQTGQ